MRALVFGGFRLQREVVFREMDALHAQYHFTEILHTNTPGAVADRLAAEWAQVRGVKLITVETTGARMRPRKATKIRNPIMLAQKPDILIAFKFGTGTMDLLRRAAPLGLKIVKVDWN